jgi:hypothetical protein
VPVDVPAALADLSRAFAQERVRWYVFGAQAVIATGVIRTTDDIDVTVEEPATGAASLLATLEAAGFVLRPVGNPATFIAATRVVPVKHVRTGIPVDVILAGPGIEEEMFSRVQMRAVGRTRVPFVDTADLIALKMLAGRPKDVEDVRSIVRACPPDLSIAVARQRVLTLGEIVDDSTLVRTFDRLVSQETAGVKPRGSRGSRRKPATAAKKAPAKKPKAQRRKTSPRRR